MKYLLMISLLVMFGCKDDSKDAETVLNIAHGSCKIGYMAGSSKAQGLDEIPLSLRMEAGAYCNEFLKEITKGL